jgi:heme O synthase-like polyprenyltransferase
MAGAVENLESILIGVFSVMLLLLSLSSYKKTGLKNILYAAMAFALFAIDVFLEYLVEQYDPMNYPLLDLFHTSITLAILALFFVSVVKRNQ